MLNGTAKSRREVIATLVFVLNISQKSLLI